MRYDTGHGQRRMRLAASMRNDTGHGQRLLSSGCELEIRIIFPLNFVLQLCP